MIYREPQRTAAGAPAAPTPSDHSTAYPGGGASKNSMAVAVANFRTTRSPDQHEKRGIDPKHRGHAQDLDSCTAVAVPRVAFQGSRRPRKAR